MDEPSGARYRHGMRSPPALARSLALAGGLAFVAAACTLLNPLEGYTGGAPDTGPDVVVTPPIPEETGFVDAGADRDAAPSCVSALPPERPVGVGGGAKSFVNAFVSFEAGDPRDPSAPNTQGYDLDRTCTCPGPRSCKPASGPGVCDYPNGVDNAAGTYLLSLLTVLGDGNTITARLRAGTNGLLLRVSGYNEQPDDSEVELALFTSFGLEGANDGGPDAPRPKLDGTDRWTVDRSSLFGGVPYVPTIFDTRAYVRGGVLVASFSGLVRVGTYPLPVVGGLITGRLSKTGDSYAILDGVVSGRFVVTKFLTGLESVPHPLTPGAYLCGTDRLYLNLRDSICASRDLLEDPTQDGKDGACDASSFAVRFTSVPSVLGNVVEPGSPVRACGDAWAGSCP